MKIFEKQVELIKYMYTSNTLRPLCSGNRPDYLIQLNEPDCDV